MVCQLQNRCQGACGPELTGPELVGQRWSESSSEFGLARHKKNSVVSPPLNWSNRFSTCQQQSANLCLNGHQEPRNEKDTSHKRLSVKSLNTSETLHSRKTTHNWIIYAPSGSARRKHLFCLCVVCVLHFCFFV